MLRFLALKTFVDSDKVLTAVGLRFRCRESANDLVNDNPHESNPPACGAVDQPCHHAQDIRVCYQAHIRGFSWRSVQSAA